MTGNRGKWGGIIFSLSDEDGKIVIEGRTGVCLATGFNHYLKYCCNAHVSQMSKQVDLPDEPVPVGEPVRRETPFQTRYSYNYCTLSYTMAFWGAIRVETRALLARYERGQPRA